MSVDLSKYSLAVWYGKGEQHKCNYCKDPSGVGSISYGMHTEELSVDDYKDLIDRGWRRSGKYCYKPIMDKICCPLYTIRCDAVQFTMNKSHKKIVKKFNKFLSDGILNKNDIPNVEGVDNTISCIPEFEKHSTINLNIPITSEEHIRSADVSSPDNHHEVADVKQSASQGNDVNSSSKTNSMDNNDAKMLNKNQCKGGIGADANKPPCKKAKLLRLERKRQKLLKKGEEIQTTIKQPNNIQKSLNQFLEEVPANSKHRLKIVIEKMDKTHRTFDRSAELYKKYQMAVHNDPPSECGPDEFYDFLVSTPLKSKPFPNGIEGPGYGSFHQQYWLDDKLIAVGVIDILPGCVSSVYFFYDPDYRSFTLGTYGSLREVQLVQDFQRKIPDLRYYYMGFYIHSCPKMRYKGRLHPSYLLCPETYVWFPIEMCLAKLDVSKYSKLNDNSDDADVNACTANDVDCIKVVYNHLLMQLKDYLVLTQTARSEFEDLGAQVGNKCIHNFVFWIE